ncbi:MAG: hypothetical protein Q7S92_05410 [Candidatus Diapherotrites archaeon]|nr:hypothetical protein [Candidatus Diapherotrites archaeon]
MQKKLIPILILLILFLSTGCTQAQKEYSETTETNKSNSLETNQTTGTITQDDGKLMQLMNIDCSEIAQRINLSSIATEACEEEISIVGTGLDNGESSASIGYELGSENKACVTTLRSETGSSISIVIGKYNTEEEGTKAIARATKEESKDLEIKPFTDSLIKGFSVKIPGTEISRYYGVKGSYLFTGSIRGSCSKNSTQMEKFTVNVLNQLN